jgi:hypothetical protein
MTCTCGRICVGPVVTEARSWDPDCPDHGTASAWWNSTDQVEQRREQDERLRDLQRRAAAARKAARGLG